MSLQENVPSCLMLWRARDSKIFPFRCSILIFKIKVYHISAFFYCRRREAATLSNKSESVLVSKTIITVRMILYACTEIKIRVLLRAVDTAAARAPPASRCPRAPPASTLPAGRLRSASPSCSALPACDSLAASPPSSTSVNVAILRLPTPTNYPRVSRLAVTQRFCD